MREGYIIPKEKKVPEAEVVLWEEPSSGKRSWVVERCPYCGKKHMHDAGTSADDPKTYLGHWPSLCKKKYPSDIGYKLVEK